MIKKTKTVGEAEIEYYVKGDKPALLIHSGTHGDEASVIEIITQTVIKYEDRLPNFIFVPVVSPSAVERNTRRNKDGVDMNRSFYDDCKIPEVQANMQIMQGNSFEKLVSFHEDGDFDAKFYMYDIRGEVLEDTRQWHDFKKEVLATGIELLNGLDDPKDSKLGYLFVDGYRYFELGDVREGVSYWAADHKIIQKALEPEIPTRLSSEEKIALIDLIFRHFLINDSK